MNRKNIKNLILSFWVIIWIISFTPSNAVNLTFNFNRTIEVSSIDSEIRLIHFSEFKNDFWWLFYFKWLNDIFNPTQEEEEYQYKIVDDDDYSVHCNNQLKWFYYNAERWERLWPIDEDTKNTRGFTGLNMTWWIYANCTPNLENFQEELSKCSSDEEWVEEENQEKTSECIESIKEKYLDMFSFYGGVTHEYSWQNFVLAVWVKYGTWLPWIDVKPQLWKSFQWIEGEGSSLPFGLIYDNLWWVWFAGCKIKDKSALTQIVEDLIGNNTWIISLFHIQTGENDSKILVYNRDIGEDGKPTLNLVDCNSVLENANSALKILVEWLIWMWKEKNINYYKERDDKDSLQKTQYFASANINNATLINYAIQKAETLCRWKWKNSDGYTTTNGINCIIGNIALNETDRNKTIIVKNWNVTIKPFSNNENTYYDIFIDSWNLIIDEWDLTKKFLIKTNGFVWSDEDSIIEEFRNECYSIMHNIDRIQDPDKYENLWYIWLASILKWNFIVNGSIIWTDYENWLKNKYFIYWKLTSLDDNDKLADTFKWRCDGWLTSTNGQDDRDYCPGPRVGGKLNQYQNAPLVIIDQNYNSPMLKWL